MRAALAGLTLLVATAATAASAEPAPARAMELRALVRHDCGSCHGMTLKGGLGLPLTPDRLAEIPAEALAAAILDGRPGTPMPPWRGLLSEADADWIARYIKGETDAP